ncbi:hypothetical protein ACFQ5M_10440 [Agrilactobacillus yilanensis]|uniref:Tetratricopeptide repeat protein n=1 Tax=Agrilactobacillus yilanensis TaxID=2485997 RepID=A0ABW4J9Z8_9LACO|nr:hypothetical protein [Agrilactobacillus yilanensis]
MRSIIPVIPTADLYIDRAQASLERYDYGRASNQLKIALTLNVELSQRVYIVSQLAFIYEAMGQYQQAVEILKTLSTHTYQVCPELAYFMASAYAFLEDTYHSQKYLQQYLASGDRDYYDEALALQQQLAIR